MKRLATTALFCLLFGSVCAEEFSDTLALAEAGEASAQLELGSMYDTGRGHPENDAEAVKWYRKAAEQGLLGAQISLAHMYAHGEGVSQDFAEAYVWQSIATTTGGYRSMVIKREDYANRLSSQDLAKAQKHAAKLYEEIQGAKGRMMQIIRSGSIILIAYRLCL